MRKLLILTDYKGFFGSKQKSAIYNGGMDLNLLKSLFEKYDFQVSIKRFTELDFRNDDFKGIYVLYTSSEDRDLFYKDFIEDVLLGIELKGAILVPDFRFFRAHNNKVFMEILRDLMPSDDIKSIHSRCFGTIEDLYYHKNDIEFPTVYKKHGGSKSRGVGLAKSFTELLKSSKEISKSINFRDFFWEKGRKKKYPNYIPNSNFRKKFITQNFIPSLKGDWKVLIYDNKYFVLKRYNRENDFRASGGGNLKYTDDIPKGLLDYSKRIYETFDVPHLSLDVAGEAAPFHLIEFQSIYFGTYTLEYSNFHFQFINNVFTKIEEEVRLEDIFVESTVNYINKKY